MNPRDHDQIVIRVGVRDGKIAYIGANDIRTAAVTWAGGAWHEVTFKTGAEARAQGGETFAGCESARRAALVLYKVFAGLGVDEALEIGQSDVIVEMDAPPEDGACVATVVQAVRAALIDTQVTALAEAIVEVRALRESA